MAGDGQEQVVSQAEVDWEPDSGGETAVETRATGSAMSGDSEWAVWFDWTDSTWSGASTQGDSEEEEEEEGTAEARVADLRKAGSSAPASRQLVAADAAPQAGPPEQPPEQQ